MSSFSDSLRRGFACSSTLALARLAILPPSRLLTTTPTTGTPARPKRAGASTSRRPTTSFSPRCSSTGPSRPRGQPTWYTAQLTWDGQSQFVGGLYRTEGTYFNSPWNPANSTTTRSVSRRSRLARRTTTGHVLVHGQWRRDRHEVRHAATLTPILLAGNYVGGQSGTYSGCTAQRVESRLPRLLHVAGHPERHQRHDSVRVLQRAESADVHALGHSDPERIDLPHPECPVPMFRRPQHDGVRQRSAGHAPRVRRAVHRGVP
jgi:hypothetical protein